MYSENVTNMTNVVINQEYQHQETFTTIPAFSIARCPPSARRPPSAAGRRPRRLVHLVFLRGFTN